MKKTTKRRAPSRPYISQNQLVLAGFETPFSEELDKDNRWVQLSHKIPWDELTTLYLKHHRVKQTGRLSLNSRIVIGAIIIKHLGNLTDRETIHQITENVYMQYFLGYSAMSSAPRFDTSLFVEIRKRLGERLVNEISHRILEIAGFKEISEAVPSNSDNECGQAQYSKKGELLLDATITPQDITYPTDLNLLNRARHTTEKIIDTLHVVGEKKPKTYREQARKAYLKVAQSRNPSKKTIRKFSAWRTSFLSIMRYCNIKVDERRKFNTLHEADQLVFNMDAH